MKNKKVLLMGVALLGLSVLAGCGNPSRPSSSSEEQLEKVNLKMSVQYQGADTRMSFGSDDKIVPYTDLNGKMYNEGDLKPVWQAVSDRLNIAINDVTPSDKVNDSFTRWITDGFDKVDVLQGGASQIQNEAIMNSTILNLNDYMDQMPNLKAFLDSNAVVKKTITAEDGGIYYSPYFDGYDDAEKMVLMRTDWVKKLLDGNATGYDTNTVITTSYQAYMPDSLNVQVPVMENGAKVMLNKKYNAGQGIIARMNALGTKNGETLVATLKAYIADTYGSQYTNPSELFVGEKAAYDADEYVALLRCIKANPNFLTGQSEKPLVPLYPRESKNSRTSDLFSFMGQLYGIRGLASKSGFLYIDSEGNVQDARWEQATVNALERFHQLYEEGLILENFTDKNSGGSTDGGYYKTLHANNLAFSTFDYCQTQTALNETYVRNKDASKNIEGYCFQPVLAPLARWNGSNEYTRFQESWRSVKTEGWCISANLKNPGNEDKLARALRLFDYFWSDEGNRLMSYGPDEYLAHNEDGTIATIEYNGRQVPKLADGTIDQLKNLASYNYTNYYRKYLGGTFPIGYIKEQGMEYQCNVIEGKEGLDIVTAAIQAGIVEHPDVTWTNADKWYWICPTTFALDSNAASAITNNYPLLDEITNDSSKSNIWAKYVQYGFGGTDGTTTLLTKDAYVEYYRDTANGTGYVALYNEAFQTMI